MEAEMKHVCIEVRVVDYEENSSRCEIRIDLETRKVEVEMTDRDGFRGCAPHLYFDGFSFRLLSEEVDKLKEPGGDLVFFCR